MKSLGKGRSRDTKSGKVVTPTADPRFYTSQNSVSCIRWTTHRNAALRGNPETRCVSRDNEMLMQECENVTMITIGGVTPTAMPRFHTSQISVSCIRQMPLPIPALPGNISNPSVSNVTLCVRGCNSLVSPPLPPPLLHLSKWRFAYPPEANADSRVAKHIK